MAYYSEDPGAFHLRKLEEGLLLLPTPHALTGRERSYLRSRFCDLPQVTGEDRASREQFVFRPV
jgi:hypothetical protein